MAEKPLTCHQKHRNSIFNSFYLPPYAMLFAIVHHTTIVVWTVVQNPASVYLSKISIIFLIFRNLYKIIPVQRLIKILDNFSRYHNLVFYQTVIRSASLPRNSPIRPRLLMVYTEGMKELVFHNTWCWA